MEFKELFERYGYTVEQVGENSFVAKNENFFVAYSVYNFGGPVAAMCSFYLCDLEAFLQQWKHINAGRRIPQEIGSFAFSGMMNRLHDFHPCGLCNHDHMPFEVEWWLQRHSKA